MAESGVRWHEKIKNYFLNEYIPINFIFTYLIHKK